jgi:ectoine hydroxylase-related dioxygenase (phytanoyl-CoA dioxygenase family)
MSKSQRPAARAKSLVAVIRKIPRRGLRAARRIARDPRFPGTIRRRARAAIKRARDSRPPLETLTPAQALHENGFTIFRGLFPPDECAQLATEFKHDAGIEEGVHFTKVDATNRIPSARKVLFDERILNAVRSSLRSECRFLQPSDLHYLHDTAGWHRDSVHRAQDNSASADWSDRDGPYGVVKAILYMESDNAAMGIVAGSHLSPIEIDRDLVKMIEKLGGQIVIDTTDEPNRRFSAGEKHVPMAWKAMPGDVLVFDERMYHAGRRVDNGKVTKNREAAKFTLSLVFGSDNMHSQRFYSYFRYARRELGYRDMPPDYRAALEAQDLVLHNGLSNYYEQYPQELRLVHLRKPETMDELVEKFSAAGRH